MLAGAAILALAGVCVVATLLFAPMTAKRDAADWWKEKVADVSGDNQACGSFCYRPTWHGYDKQTCSANVAPKVAYEDIHVRNMTCAEVTRILRAASHPTAPLAEALERQDFHVKVKSTCCGNGDYVIADKSNDRSFELKIG